MELSDHARHNQAAWNEEAASYVEPARAHWARSEIGWGMWDVPEAEVGALPDADDADVVELGCGTAYISAWLARAGARPVGVDLSENQMATARECQDEHDLHFPLIHASAEDVPLPDGCADLVVSEYGASLWCDPDLWLPEAARLLRPGGRLVFLTNSLLITLTSPPVGPCTDRLARDQKDLRVVTFPEEAGIQFNLAHGDWIATLARHGFTVTGLHELYAPEGAEPTRFDWVSVEWAQRWPVEEIWTAVKASA